jgi:flagellar biosynthetic protein FlhB
MAEQGGERTEEATPRKRQEARDEGRIPRSQELTVAAALLTMAFVLNTIAPRVASRLMAMMGSGLANAGDPAFNAEGAVRMLQGLGWQTLGTIALIACAMAGVSLLVGAGQARGVVSLKPIMPQWERISPAANASRIFGVQSGVELLKSLLKLVIVAIAIRSVLGGDAMRQIVGTAQESPAGLLEVVRHYSVKLVMTAGIAYLALALADYLWQYWRYQQQLRMTKEEVKQEMKNQEGDPLLKQRMRSMARQKARRQMFRDVPKADVVIVNPTHRAIALQYDPTKAPAPIVLAMGQRKVAERIKKIALEHGIPVVENRPLAIALIKQARVGMVIPIELYLAVAEVLAFVLRQRQERNARWAYRPVNHLVGDSV